MGCSLLVGGAVLLCSALSTVEDVRMAALKIQRQRRIGALRWWSPTCPTEVLALLPDVQHISTRSCCFECPHQAVRTKPKRCRCVSVDQQEAKEEERSTEDPAAAVPTKALLSTDRLARPSWSSAAATAFSNGTLPRADARSSMELRPVLMGVAGFALLVGCCTGWLVVNRRLRRQRRRHGKRQAGDGAAISLRRRVVQWVVGLLRKGWSSPAAVTTTAAGDLLERVFDKTTEEDETSTATTTASVIGLGMGQVALRSLLAQREDGEDGAALLGDDGGLPTNVYQYELKHLVELLLSQPEPLPRSIPSSKWPYYESELGKHYGLRIRTIVEPERRRRERRRQQRAQLRASAPEAQQQQFIIEAEVERAGEENESDSDSDDDEL